MIRRPPRSTPKPSSAASDVYKRQGVAGYVPLSQALLYLRKPGLHSAIVFAGVVLNIILNAVLIDMFGMEGAAIATSVSLVVTLMIIRAAVRRVDKIVI